MSRCNGGDASGSERSALSVITEPRLHLPQIGVGRIHVGRQLAGPGHRDAGDRGRKQDMKAASTVAPSVLETFSGTA